MVDISHVPKDILLFELWSAARSSPYTANVKPENITLDKIRYDLHYIRLNNCTELTHYHGRILFVDITHDKFDTTQYNIYNGRFLAEKIIAKVKLGDLRRMITRYYTIF